MPFPWPPGGGDDPSFEVELVANYEFNSDVEIDFDTDNEYDNDVDIDEEICWTPYVDGNSVAFNIDAQAFGDDTLVDVSVVALASIGTEEQMGYSSFAASGVVIALG